MQKINIDSFLTQVHQGLSSTNPVGQKSKLTQLGDAEKGSPNSTKTLQAKQVEIPLLQIGDFTEENVTALLFDFKQRMPDFRYDGIIGLSYFGTNAVGVDYQKNRLIIDPTPLNKSTLGVVEADISRIVTVDLGVNQEVVKAHLDTGSPAYISFPFSYTEKFELLEDLKFKSRAKTMGSDFEVYESPIKGKIQLGSILLENPQVQFNKGDFKTINIGYEFLKDYLIYYDKQSGLISLK